MKIALLYPELLGTYGDGGNVLALVERSVRRGIEASVSEVHHGDEVPEADLYVLGGGEDGPQRMAADLLRASSFASRVSDGARVLAICAGLQILGTSFCVEGDDEYQGLGMVECVTRRGSSRSVGNLGTEVHGDRLVGFENHGGVTELGADLRPLGRVLHGRGNDGSVDGFVTDSIWATYAHGPVLALNPWFCDEIIAVLANRELDELATVADELYRRRCDVVFA